MDALVLRLRPLVDHPCGPRIGPALRAVPVPGGVEVGVVVPGHADMRGGVVSAEELAVFAGRLAALANRLAVDAWEAVGRGTVPAGRTREGA